MSDRSDTFRSPCTDTDHWLDAADQMLLRLAFVAAARPPLPANVPPLARAYTLVMVDRVQDGAYQASSELSSSSRSFNWGGDTTKTELPTFGGLPTEMTHPFPLRRALWFEGWLRERPVSDPVEMRRHDGTPLRQPRGPASTHSPRASLPAATMHNPRMKPRSLAYDCARLCRRKPATLAQQAHRGRQAAAQPRVDPALGGVVRRRHAGDHEC